MQLFVFKLDRKLHSSAFNMARSRGKREEWQAVSRRFSRHVSRHACRSRSSGLCVVLCVLLWLELVLVLFVLLRGEKKTKNEVKREEAGGRATRKSNNHREEDLVEVSWCVTCQLVALQVEETSSRIVSG